MTLQLKLQSGAFLTCARLLGLLLMCGAVVSTNVVVNTAAATEPLSRPVAAGAAHSLAIDPAAGRVWAWGNNLTGQLGVGDQAPRLVPTLVSALTGTFVAVSAGAATV